MGSRFEQVDAWRCTKCNRIFTDVMEAFDCDGDECPRFDLEIVPTEKLLEGDSQ